MLKNLPYICERTFFAREEVKVKTGEKISDEQRKRFLAWQLTLEMDFRGSVRTYRRNRRVKSVFDNVTFNRNISEIDGTPQEPWALYLADEETGKYRYLCFDFDAHDGNEETAAAAAEQAQKCAEMLEEHGICAVLCRSGKTGGHHVWTAASDGIDAGLAAEMARNMSLVFSTLDPMPLLNPATGCARPPESPHRDGSYSVVLKGDPDSLAFASNRAADYESVARTLNSLAAAAAEQTEGTARDVRRKKRAGRKTAMLDGSGIPHAAGFARNLSKNAQALLKAKVTDRTDASARMFSILLSAARANWTFEQVCSLAVKDNPGMTHALYRRDSDGKRAKRSAEGTGGVKAVIKRMWIKAVNTVCENSAVRGNDETFLQRSEETARIAGQAVAAARSDEFFSTASGASALRVLFALAKLCLQARRTSVQANVRTVSLMTGLSKQTAAKQLHVLEKRGYASLAKTGEGKIANEWKLNEKKNVGNTENISVCKKADTSEYAPRRSSADPCLPLLKILSCWLALASHDAHTRQGFGISAGNIRASRLCRSRRSLKSALSSLDRDASRLGVSGVRRRRAAAYRAERLLYYWFLNELDWMRSRKPKCRPCRKLTLRNAGKDFYPAMPRSFGRINYPEAQRQIAGLFERAS